VSFHLTVQIDPHAVLGVAPGASLQAIRDAYRTKVKQHHPDAGGEEWAFRIVAQAYEILSTERVSQATHAEFRARPTRPAKPAWEARSGNEKEPPRQNQAEKESASSGSPPRAAADGVRAGISDPVHDPVRVVNVEKLWVRYEVDHVWLLHEGSSEDRFLSCCLNISWPDPTLASRAESLPGREEILHQLTEAYDAVRRHTPIAAARCETEDHRFQGWLSYAGTQPAWAAFNKLHQELNARGLSVKQWTRDLIIPRQWR
jgi:curved DNA-binding protein CbpA